MPQDTRMETKTILITGGSSGIGAALALTYAKPGNHLLLTGRNLERLKAVSQQCQQQGARCRYANIDVTDQQAMHDWLIEQDQLRPIDIIIANAGLSSQQIKTAEQSPHTVELNMIDIHLKGTLNTIHPLMKAMKARQSGQLVLMSSMNAFIPLADSRIYGAVKAAILHYGLALRAHLHQDNIKVNIICPGWVSSRLTDLNRFPMPLKLKADHAAKKIIQGIKRDKAVITFPKIIRLCTIAFQLLPLVVQQWILRKLINQKK